MPPHLQAEGDVMSGGAGANPDINQLVDWRANEALAALPMVAPDEHRSALRHFAGGEARACLGHDQYHPVGSCRRAAKEVLHTCHPLLLGAPPWGLESPKNAKCMSHKNVV